MNWKRTLLETTVLLLSVLASTYFLLPGFSHSVAIPDNTDTHLSVAVVAHVAHCIATGQLAELYHFPIYFPLPYTATAGVNMFGQGALAAPLWALGIRDLPLIYNLLILFALLMSALGMRRLLSAVGLPFGMAILGAVLFTLHPFKQISYLHMNLIFYFPIVWAFYFLLCFFKEKRASGLVAFGACLVMQSFFDLSLFFLSAIFFAGFWLLAVLMLSKDKLKSLLKGLGVFLLAGLVVGFIFRLYLQNPLGIVFNRGVFDMMTLIPGYYFFSSWHPLVIQRYVLGNVPMFYGIISFLFMAHFFWRPALGETVSKPHFLGWWLLMAAAVLVPFLAPLLPLGLDGQLLLWLGDIGVLLLTALFVWAFIRFKKEFSPLERWLSMVLLVMVFCFFRAPYRLLPEALNPLNLLSHFLSQISRLRGFKLYYFLMPLLLVPVMIGAQRWFSGKWTQKRFRLATVVLILAWLFEMVPAPLSTGHLIEPRRRELLAQTRGLAPDSGMLILPHYRGDPVENMYLCYLQDHNHAIYNGYLGVGINDPLKLYEKGIMAGDAMAIARQVVDTQVMGELVQARVLLLVVDRLQLIEWDKLPSGAESRDRQEREYWRQWRELCAAFRTAQKKGLLASVKVKGDGIIAVLNDRLSGTEVTYQLGARALSMTGQVHLTINTVAAVNLTWQWDDQSIQVMELLPGKNQVSFPNPRTLWQPIRRLHLSSEQAVEFFDLKPK